MKRRTRLIASIEILHALSFVGLRSRKMPKANVEADHEDEQREKYGRDSVVVSDAHQVPTDFSTALGGGTPRKQVEGDRKPHENTEKNRPHNTGDSHAHAPENDREPLRHLVQPRVELSSIQLLPGNSVKQGASGGAAA
jgi:hypothetical protein